MSRVARRAQLVRAARREETTRARFRRMLHGRHALKGLLDTLK